MKWKYTNYDYETEGSCTQMWINHDECNLKFYQTSQYFICFKTFVRAINFLICKGLNIDSIRLQHVMKHFAYLLAWIFVIIYIFQMQFHVQSQSIISKGTQNGQKLHIKLQEIMTSFRSLYKWVLKAEGGEMRPAVSHEKKRKGGFKSCQ